MYTIDGWFWSPNTTLTGDWDVKYLILSLTSSVYGIVLLFAGTAGNLCLALILGQDRRRLNTKTKVLFCLMAALDTGVLWIAIPRYWTRVTFQWDFRVAHPQLCPYHVFAVYVSSNLAGSVYSVLCVDRCLVIYHKLEGRRIKATRERVPVGSVQRSQTDGGCGCCVSFHPVHCTSTGSNFRKTGVGIHRKSSLKIEHTCHESTLKRFRSVDQLTNKPTKYLKRLSESNLQHIELPTLQGHGRKWRNCFAALSLLYVRHSNKWIVFGMLLSATLIFLKHSVAFSYVHADLTNGCHSHSVAAWRDYSDFFTQSILPYLIIIPANLAVYRALKRHRMLLVSLKMTATHGARVAVPKYPLAHTKPQRRRTLTSIDQIDQHPSIKPVDSSSHSPTVPRSTETDISPASHLAKNHMYVFKTLITLGILHFVINLPGSLYAQVILHHTSNWWIRTLEGNLLYDTLLMISFTNNGASFFILLCTVNGFRSRVRSFYCCENSTKKLTSYGQPIPTCLKLPQNSQCVSGH
ncbi:hypothetical protein P879_10871 [Paragonimus westermani]|uniref:G-protein coupled receptors family 1 profile domain-containing protein n=1 Tax=Paragonimus westermani TaxID=34504 RepID=A0A8T0DA08_9TREM|nr:hypothetical protein P879_10871 [Paragonimus westermani]